MTRILAIIVILGGLGVLAYFLGAFPSGDEASETMEDAMEAAEEAAETTEDSVEDAVDEAEDAATDLVDEASDAVEDAVDEAVDTATDAVEDVVDEATDAVEGALDDATEAVEGALEDLTGGDTIVDGAADVVTDALAPELFTVDGFDLDTVLGAIDGSDLTDLRKLSLTEALNAAADNPDALGPVLQQIQEALGL